MYRNILTLISLVFLGFSLWAGWKGDSPNGVLITGLIAFLVLLLVANIDRISEFRITKSSIEAKMKEAKEIVDQGKHTVKELQILSKAVVSVMLSFIQKRGRLGTYSENEKEGMKESLLNILQNINVPVKEQEELLEEWHKTTECDYVWYILGSGKNYNHLSDECRNELNKLRGRGIENIPSPGELTMFLKKYGFLSNEAEELIKDYEHYKNFKKHRRFNVWEKHSEWDILIDHKAE